MTHRLILYSIKLNTYPDTMMQAVTTPKKIASILVDITFFKSMASGNDNAITDIEKAIAVPSGIPF